MQKLFFTLLFAVIIQYSFAQILNPVKFTYTAIKKGNNQYEVTKRKNERFMQKWRRI